MQTKKTLEDRLNGLKQGARWFQVLATVLLVLGLVQLSGGGLTLLTLLRPGQGWGAPLTSAASAALNGLMYLAFAWFARRVGDAFSSIVDVICELGEIV